MPVTNSVAVLSWLAVGAIAALGIIIWVLMRALWRIGRK